MLGVACLILGIVFLVVGLYTLVIKIPKSRAQTERRTGKTVGKVTEVIVKTYETKKKNSPGYRETKTYKSNFAYSVNGTEYTIKGIATMPPPAEGDDVDISYNPENPADAHVDKYFADAAANKSGGLIILGISGVLLLIGIVGMIL